MMRGVQAMYLDKRATVYGRVEANTGVGQSVSYVTVASRVPARLAPANTLRESIAEKITENFTHVVTLQWDTPIDLTHRVQIDSRMFDIVRILSGGSWETAKRLLCSETK
jgi:head-tail adaptor